MSRKFMSRNFMSRNFQSPKTLPRQRKTLGAKLLPLFPLALVATAIGALAVATRSTESPQPPRQQVASVNAADTAAAEEAAAKAVIAMSLARTAPTLSEEEIAAQEQRAKPAGASTSQKNAMTRQPPPARDAAKDPPQPGAPLKISPHAPTGDTVAPEPANADKPAEAKTGFLARVAEYAPSPRRIAGAVGDGVSKLAGYIPGL